MEAAAEQTQQLQYGKLLEIGCLAVAALNSAHAIILRMCAGEKLDRFDLEAYFSNVCELVEFAGFHGMVPSAALEELSEKLNQIDISSE